MLAFLPTSSLSRRRSGNWHRETRICAPRVSRTNRTEQRRTDDAAARCCEKRFRNIPSLVVRQRALAIDLSCCPDLVDMAGQRSAYAVHGSTRQHRSGRHPIQLVFERSATEICSENLHEHLSLAGGITAENLPVAGDTVSAPALLVKTTDPS